MNSRQILLVLLSVLVALAGCSGSPGTGTDTIENGTDSPDAADDEDDADGSSSTGTVNFYMSDRPGALDDFRSLNVTISRVGFKQAGTTATDGNNTTAANESENGSDGSEAGWVEYDINETTVDLTRLVGDNATRLDSIAVPNGSYEKVFAYVSEVNGTLTDGSSQRVKLPSEKLKLNSQFTVGANESVDFVFDIQVHEAGRSGKYILRPVISESGTDKDIREVDARSGRQSMDRDGGDEGADGEESDNDEGNETA